MILILLFPFLFSFYLCDVSLYFLCFVFPWLLALGVFLINSFMHNLKVPLVEKFSLFTFLVAYLSVFSFIPDILLYVFSVLF